MGSVHKPEGRLKRKKEEAFRDLSPELREAMERLIEGYQGSDLEEKLDEIIRLKKTRDLIEKTR